MANEYPGCIGEVDVVSDAENIKKLLKIPFANSHVSLMVHRIGKTLLLDDFDVSRFLLNEEKQQWKWLKRFLEEMFKMEGKLIPRKNRSRSNLQSKNMFSKFLYYSMASLESDAIPNDLVSEEERTTSYTSEQLSLSPSKQNQEDTWTLDLSYDSFARELDVTCDDSYSTGNENSSNTDNNSYLRNLFWTFENIQMLLGSDMPIFGDSNHPAVSLRLRDMSKPINVLTGIDYWLDNLMCSVPEVVMCYHLDGIVQKYELMKTEDIPQMKNSQFSPKVIRDIAQNILTFLKSKATKSGHTYWLLKSKEGDVVKLYDLTTLCENYFDENSTNPYALPVAMLLYRVAKHLMDEGFENKKRVYDLLSNCLNLIDEKRHKKIAVSVRYLLTQILIPNNVDPTLPEVVNEANASDDDKSFFDYFSSSQSNTEDSGDETTATLKVNDLTISRNPRKVKTKVKKKKANKNSDLFLGSDWGKRGNQALKHLSDGLMCLISDADCYFKSSKNSSPLRDEVQKMAKPFEPIPMGHTSLNPNECSVVATINDFDSCAGKEVAASDKVERNWKKSQTVLLLHKAAQIFCFFSELESGKSQHKKALKYVRLGLLCDQTAKSLKAAYKDDTHREILPCLLGSCGDCHVFILKEDNFNYDEQENCRLDMEETYVNICSKLNPKEDEKYSWCFDTSINIDKRIEERFILAARCYEQALVSIDDINDSYKVGKSTSIHELRAKLKRKYGNVCNELSCLYMSIATNIFDSSEKKTENLYLQLENITKKSLAYLEKGMQAFDSIQDTINSIFIYSNTGKLMRVCAHIFAPFDSQNRRLEFNPKEKHFYAKAISYYETAMNRLVSVRSSKDLMFCYDDIWDQLNWDLCTTLFTMGSLLQDFAPLSYCAFEEIEREIDSALHRALKLCLNAEENKTKRLCLYQYRAGTIHHKLSSLYHHSFRNMSDNDSKRRQTFQLADDHFEAAMNRFEKLENKVEYLETLLERVGMHEHLMLSLSGFGSKIKEFQRILQILIATEKTSKMKVEVDEDEADELLKLLKLVLQRIQLCVKGLLKMYSTKSSKFKENQQRWKTLDEQLSSSVLDKLLKKDTLKNSLEVYIWDLCEKCSKTLEIELRCN
ncbi:erythroid differentiation-related factor 1-like protein [Leptotrombidium deliense]|uniref:Erythroid differentiation-related factor 1-like protein n=1 Tax=Leptotrombidium deliense TaxID=299467 RepID=A0A443STD8_9ACAR|nr:erythroid differentiation-related factor 1-like protein [Leptotrombidium deliense]